MRISTPRLVRLGVIATLGLLPTPGGASVGVGSDARRMTIGDPNAGHIDIVVKYSRRQAQSIAVRLYRVGAPGSRFTLSIGGHPVVAPFILSATQCRFDAVGSLCLLAIGPRDRGYRPLLVAFQSKKRARVSVENAGNMAMSTEVSLRSLAGDDQLSR